MPSPRTSSAAARSFDNGFRVRVRRVDRLARGGDAAPGEVVAGFAFSARPSASSVPTIASTPPPSPRLGACDFLRHDLRWDILARARPRTDIGLESSRSFVHVNAHAATTSPRARRPAARTAVINRSARSSSASSGTYGCGNGFRSQRVRRERS